MKESTQTMEELKEIMLQIHNDTKLLPSVATTLLRMDNRLFDAALGKDQIPKESVEVLFAQYSKTFASTVRILGAVIFVLLAVLAFILTGKHFGWIPNLGV